MNTRLAAAFGNIDIYLFDQLLKGTYDNCHKVIDIGCGGGRNIVYLLQHGFEVFGIDADVAAISNVQALAQSLVPGYPIARFVVATAEAMPFAPASFDLVICSAVLHFARDDAHFDNMLRAAWAVLKPGGYFFARLASDIGIEDLVHPLGGGRYLLPDGSTRYLVSEHTLLQYTHELNAELHEPIKTTNVSNMRCMTTWCMRKK